MQQTFTLVFDYLKTKTNKQLPAMEVDAYEPSDSIIRNILNYSKSLTVYKSKSVGFIEIVGS